MAALDDLDALRKALRARPANVTVKRLQEFAQMHGVPEEAINWKTYRGHTKAEIVEELDAALRARPSRRPVVTAAEAGPPADPAPATSAAPAALPSASSSVSPSAVADLREELGKVDLGNTQALLAFVNEFRLHLCLSDGTREALAADLRRACDP